jgi:hypothetical protein
LNVVDEIEGGVDIQGLAEWRSPYFDWRIQIVVVL